MTEEEEKKEPRIVYHPPWPFTTGTDVLGASSFLSFGTPPPQQTVSNIEKSVTISTSKETQQQGSFIFFQQPVPNTEEKVVILSTPKGTQQQQGSFIGSIFQFGPVDGESEVLPTLPRNNPASPYYDSRRQSIKKETKVGTAAEGGNETFLHSLLHTSTKEPPGIFEEQVVMPSPPLQVQLKWQRQLEATEHVQLEFEQLQIRFNQLTTEKAVSDQRVQETELLVKDYATKLDQQLKQKEDLQLRLDQHIAVCQRDHGDKLSNLLLTLDTANRKLEEQRKSYDTEVQSLRIDLASAQRIAATAAMFEMQAEQLQKELTVANGDRAAMASLRSELTSDQERLTQLQKTSELRLAEALKEGQKQIKEIRDLKTQLAKAQSEMIELRTCLSVAESADSKSSSELTIIRKQNAELLKDNVEKTKEIADLAIQRRAEKFEVERLQSALDTQV